jgi:hypothetical protein
MTLKKIVLGGQTGVDRAALDAALAANFSCGGWAPGDRMAEDGIIPERYPLIALPNGSYRQRTRLNVSDSDGTVVFYNELLKDGTRLTRNLCALLKRPYILINAREIPDPILAGSRPNSPARRVIRRSKSIAISQKKTGSGVTKVASSRSSTPLCARRRPRVLIVVWRRYLSDSE